MNLDLEVEGLRELERKLLSLETKVGARVLRATLRKAAKPMLETAKRLVPYDLNDPDGPDGYHLRDYMRIQLEPKRTRKGPAEFRLGPARLSSNGRIAGGLSRKSNSPNYALEIEKESPYLRPSFDQHFRQLITDFTKALAKALDRELARL